MSNDRFEAIETKLAHQEALLLDLNEAVTQQQDTITKLEALCDSMRDRLRSLGDSLPVDLMADEKPPHY